MKPTTRNVSCVVWIAVDEMKDLQFNVGSEPRWRPGIPHPHIHKLWLIHVLSEVKEGFGNQEVLRKTVPDSFVVSPLSARLGAALIAVGARGNTAEELTSALHLPNDPGVIKKTVIRFLAAPKTNNESEVLFANALFPSDEYPLKQRYVADAHTYFRAHVQTVDYQQSEEVMETINRWAAEKTHNLIRNMVEPHELRGVMDMIIISVAYFKGEFTKVFRPAKLKPFFVSDNVVKKVPIMKGRFNTFYEDLVDLEARAIEIPYKGRTHNLLILLPYDIEGLSNLEDKMVGIDLSEIHLQNHLEVKVWLPKIELFTKTRVLDILGKMGVSELFSNGDLSGISGKNISVDEFWQHSGIQISESSTEAISANALSYHAGFGYSHAKPEAVVEFRADHPFMFIIRENSGPVLFIGRYLGPNDDSPSSSESIEHEKVNKKESMALVGDLPIINVQN